jgi:hypothetical protein
MKDLIIDTAKKNGETDEKIKPVADAIQWKAKAETAEGASVDHFVVDVEKFPNAAADAAGLEKFKSFVGKEGVLFRVAALPDNHVVVTFGGGAKRFGSVAKLAATDDTGLSESAGIKLVANRLPQGPRVAEGYLALDNVLEFVMSTAAQFGSPIPMPLALRNAAPLTMTVTKVGDSATESQVLIPIELMSSVKELVGPLMMMMGGGGGGGLSPSEGGAPPPPGELK